jgi:hypothetical protein
MSIVDRVNSNLQALYDVINDNIYKSLICDKDGAIPGTITKPTDIDIGAIASQIEYLRKQAILLVQQLFLDQATGEFLKYQLNEYFDSLQLEDETESEWVQRTIATVFQHKVSRATIIYSLRPYSSLEPEITNIIQESAFADFCFADIYTKGSYTMDDGTYVVWVPAIAETYESSFFTIKIILYDTATEDIWTVQNILRKIIAAGISYILVIQYTTT